MSFIVDLVSLATASIGILFAHRVEFLIVLGIALALAGLCGYCALNYSKLWNLRFTLTGFHIGLCIFAGILTFAFVLLLASFQFTKTAAESSIETWKLESLRDRSGNKPLIAKLTPK